MAEDEAEEPNEKAPEPVTNGPDGLDTDPSPEAPTETSAVPGEPSATSAVEVSSHLDVGDSSANADPSRDAPVVEADSGNVSIDFVILPEGYGQTKQVDINRTIARIRADLEGELSVPENTLFLMNLSGTVEIRDVLPDAKSLLELGIRPGDRVGIELRINYYQEQPAEEYVMPDTLEFRVANAQGEQNVVTVHVQRPLAEKPYLGGYRSRQTGALYHHATTQTVPQQKKVVSLIRFHREVQTYQCRTRSTQCLRDNGTQMPKTGVYIDDFNNYELNPRRPYFNSADKAALVLEKCVVIQCHARGMFARKRAMQLRKDKRERLEFQAKDAERRTLEADLRHKREVQRRMHPKTLADFQVLHQELETWRLNESKRIAESGFDESTRRAAQRELLHKETKLLQTIDKLKIKAQVQNRDAKIKKKLECMANPKVWAQCDGEITTVHTPYTTRAKELMDLYSGLRLPLLTVDERLDVLLHVKWTVKEFDCNLTREIVDLIDREADMLHRGRPEKSFVGLRRRVANLFLQFIESPEFNPEATKFQKVSRELYDRTGTHPLSTVPIKALGVA